MTEELDPERLDRLFDDISDSLRKLKPNDERVLTGAAQIGARIGRSDRWVRRTLAKLPNTPIRQAMPGGVLFVVESELMAFIDTLSPRSAA